MTCYSISATTVVLAANSWLSTPCRCCDSPDPVCGRAMDLVILEQFSRKFCAGSCTESRNSLKALQDNRFRFCLTLRTVPTSGSQDVSLSGRRTNGSKTRKKQHITRRGGLQARSPCERGGQNDGSFHLDSSADSTQHLRPATLRPFAGHPLQSVTRGGRGLTARPNVLLRVSDNLKRVQPAPETP